MQRLISGAVAKGAAGLEQHAGALGLGSVDASALTNLFTFLAYVVPIFGGIVADTKWGRFKTICVGMSDHFDTTIASHNQVPLWELLLMCSW